MDLEWCGIYKSEHFNKETREILINLEQSLKGQKWDDYFSVLEENPGFINIPFMDSPRWYSPFHYLIEENSPVEIIEQFINKGAWRTLKTMNGEKAIDIARRNRYEHLYSVLEPRYVRTVNLDLLLRIQQNFHKVIIGRINILPEWKYLRLPDLEVLLENENSQMWFSVPGMYGGFNFELAFKSKTTKLISESWSRVAGGSGQRHEITSRGSKLVAEGFA